jgi:hypothetical protein
MSTATKVLSPKEPLAHGHLRSARGEQAPAGEKPHGDAVATPWNHYEVWANTPTYANMVGEANTLLGALVLYVHARRATRGRTINLLVNDPPADGDSGRCFPGSRW